MSSWFNIYTQLLRHKAQLLHPSPRASNCSPPWFAQDRVAPCSSLPPQRLHPSIPSPPTQPTLLQLCSWEAPNSLPFLMSDFPFLLIFSWKGEELRFYPTSTSSSLLCGSPLLTDGPPSSLLWQQWSWVGESYPVGPGRSDSGVLLSGGSGHSHLAQTVTWSRSYMIAADTEERNRLHSFIWGARASSRIFLVVRAQEFWVSAHSVTVFSAFSLIPWPPL